MKYNQKLFEESIKIIRKSGFMLLELKQKKYNIIRKSTYDFVTELDLKIQNYIIKEIKNFSNKIVFSEEQKLNNTVNKKLLDFFILDPIDGTHNFIAGLDQYSISLAYVNNGSLLFGIIFFPSLDEIYTGFVGQGGKKNGEFIEVSNNGEIMKSIISYDNNFKDSEILYQNFKKLNDNSFTTRIFGSATFDCCQVAQGNLDARVFNKTKLCDIAAAKVILDESGGGMSTFKGDEIDLYNICDIIAYSKNIKNELIRVLK